MLLGKYDHAREMSENSFFNEIIGDGEYGIVANGVSFNYQEYEARVQETLEMYKNRGI